MFSWLQRRRVRVDDDLSARGLSHSFSAARYTLHGEMVQLMQRHSSGTCLDVGTGRSPFRGVLETTCDTVTTLDAERRSEGVDLIGDVQDMAGIGSASFDTVVCTQVLEHVPRPWVALEEIARVLKPGGKLLLSVPHLSAIHEAPSDFYRYTRWGLEALCRDAGLVPLEVRSAGGLVAFLGHGASYALMSSAGAVPGLRWLVWSVNYLVMVRALTVIDRLAGFKERYPCSCALVARRPSATPRH